MNFMGPEKIMHYNIKHAFLSQKTQFAIVFAKTVKPRSASYGMNTSVTNSNKKFRS